MDVVSFLLISGTVIGVLVFPRPRKSLPGDSQPSQVIDIKALGRDLRRSANQ